jgi:hypothetical protein
MGSSKTGSLDKFAKFSPAAALGSGKVKLPETGLIGMMQQNQEDKMAFNAANIAAQQQAGQQKAQYNQMLQQMRSRMAPTPFANGGNVTLRRKMFKLGGSASAHGTGLTSGLEFNQGGPVNTTIMPGPDNQLREAASRGKLIGGGLEALRKLFGFGKPREGVKLKSKIADIVRGPRTAPDANLIMRYAGKPTARALRAASLGTGILAVPGAISAAADRFLPGDYADTEQEAKGTGTERALRALRIASEAGLDFSPAGFLFEGIDYATRDPNVTGGRDLSDLIAGRERTPIEEQLGEGDSTDLGMTPDELSELANQQQRENLEEAMAMYQDLIRGEDNTNKLMTLGDAAIAAGSALMEGEGYGGAATAFNEPLAQARAQQQALDTESRAAAAQLAIGEDITSRQLQEAQRAELLATGAFDTEEEINSILLGRQFGIARTIPEDDKGEIDNDAVKQAGAGVYVDPKQRFGGLFIAVNSNNEDLITNDPEQAKQHAKS